MIFEKLFRLQEEFETLKKDENNPYFNSKYLALESILSHFIPLFNKHKILCYHYTKDDLVITRLQDFEDKESYIESEFKIFNTDPQKRGSEITYGRRYNLLQLLNINAEDDDGNLASGNIIKEKHKCQKCNSINEVEIKQGKFGNYFICPTCGQNSKSNPVGDGINWAEKPDWDKN